MNIVILGCGISGISFAQELSEKNPSFNITMIDKNNHVGGVISSVKENGFLFEQGPQAIYPRGQKGQEFLSFIEKLGLTKTIISASSSSKNRYLYCDKLLKMPSRLSEFFFSPFRKTILEACCKDWSIQSFPYEEESVADFSNRHFGTTFTQMIVEPVLSGMWAGDIEKLSMNALYPQIKLIEQKEGSLLRSTLYSKIEKIRKKNRHDLSRKNHFKQKNTSMFSFHGGLSKLAEGMLNKTSASVHLNEMIQNMSYNGSQYTITTNKQQYTADKVISALPTYVLSDLISGIDKEFSKQLLHIPYAPIAVIHCSFLNKVSSLKCFGYLKIRKHSQDILGTVFNTTIFPHHSPLGTQSFTVMIGGALFPNFESFSQDDFIKIAIHSLSTDLNIHETPHILKCHIIEKAIPQYHIGHQKRIKDLVTNTPKNLYLIGNYMAGASLIDTINFSRKQALLFC